MRVGQTAGKSKRMIEELVAQVNPKAAQAGERRLKARPLGRVGAGGEAGGTMYPPQGPVDTSQLRYGLTFVATGTLVQKFEEAKALLSHAVPSGDAQDILVRALDLLIAHERKRRFATDEAPAAEALDLRSDDVSGGIDAGDEAAVASRGWSWLDEMLSTASEPKWPSQQTSSLPHWHTFGFAPPEPARTPAPGAASEAREDLAAHDASREESGAAGRDCSREESTGVARADCSREESDGAAGHDCSREEPDGAAARPSRHIPAAVRREVYKRDRGRCAYVSPDGVPCNSRHQLELHHLQAWARGGTHDASNLELRCRVHNTLASIAEYGPDVALRYHDDRPASQDKPDFHGAAG